jgi:hypothetical protein
MPRVRVSINLPYLLLLPAGEYMTPGIGGSVYIEERAAEGEAGNTARTEA